MNLTRYTFFISDMMHAATKLLGGRKQGATLPQVTWRKRNKVALIALCEKISLYNCVMACIHACNFASIVIYCRLRSKSAGKHYHQKCKRKLFFVKNSMYLLGAEAHDSRKLNLRLSRTCKKDLCARDMT
ncbi:hypothetical protein Naga_100003g136 [Nannochloropsis gaditana]|uniref:Uncharacterized protein n=1 Tax=Nannochloropsis gaditana TaxID=72520 RepID=W7UBZ3_9STRA|nr:hypothetical protein Naga_100003g136 [Nannochloropsis gaditana]